MKKATKYAKVIVGTQKDRDTDAILITGITALKEGIIDYVNFTFPTLSGKLYFRLCDVVDDIIDIMSINGFTIKAYEELGVYWPDIYFMTTGGCVKCYTHKSKNLKIV